MAQKDTEKEKEFMQEEAVMQPETETKAAEEKKEGGIDWEERVPMMIPLDPSNPRDADAVIIVNGVVYQIKRGEQVMVPRKVYQVYLDSQQQKKHAYMAQQAKADANRD